MRRPVAAAADGDVHAALSSPTRRQLLELLRAANGSRDAHDLAETTGLHLSTVRFHLEVLCRAGLLERRTQPQTGVGRPRTVYTAVRETVDHRATYRELAAALAANLSDTTEGRAIRAEQAGIAWSEHLVHPRVGAQHTVGEVAYQMSALFAEMGFEPELINTGDECEIALHGCPFRALAREIPEVVCSVHRGLLRGGLTQLGVPVTSELLPFVEPELCVAQLAQAQ